MPTKEPRISFVVSPELLEMLDRQAESVNLTRSSWCRHLLHEAAHEKDLELKVAATSGVARLLGDDNVLAIMDLAARRMESMDPERMAAMAVKISQMVAEDEAQGEQTDLLSQLKASADAKTGRRGRPKGSKNKKPRKKAAAKRGRA